MIEIGRLAIHLRHTDALDAEGVVAAQMARDLADTRPDLMPQVFALARREFTWLPKTAEMLSLYKRAVDTDFEQRKAERQAKERADWEREAEERRLHPEAAIPIRDILSTLASPGTLAMDRPRAVPLHAVPAARVDACPHCGRAIPGGVADIRALSAEDLRSIADRRDREAAERAAALDRVEAQHLQQQSTAAKKTAKKYKKGSPQ